jgi:hypothetical protein
LSSRIHPSIEEINLVGIQDPGVAAFETLVQLTKENPRIMFSTAESLHRISVILTQNNVNDLAKS